MPIFEYQCKSCDKKTEHIERINSEPSKRRCPSCDSPTSRVEFSIPAPAQFTGSGWTPKHYAGK